MLLQTPISYQKPDFALVWLQFVPLQCRQLPATISKHHPTRSQQQAANSNKQPATSSQQQPASASSMQPPAKIKQQTASQPAFHEPQAAASQPASEPASQPASQTISYQHPDFACRVAAIHACVCAGICTCTHIKTNEQNQFEQ